VFNYECEYYSVFAVKWRNAHPGDPQILEWAFGKRMTPAERLRKNQRLLDKALRELDQQRVKLEKQEKTLVTQIKQSAQKGQMGACKIQAKDLVRTRRLVHGIRRTGL
jgi:charged multivesicular body protein 2A